MSAARWDAGPPRAAASEIVAVPPPTQPTVHVDVAGMDLRATSLVVEGEPTAVELRSSLATLVLGHEDATIRSARTALADAVAAAGTPIGAAARVESRVRASLARLGRAGRLGGVAAVVGAALGLVGVPVWLLAREPSVMRAELGVCALLAGVAMLVGAVELLSSARLGRDDDGQRRASTTAELVVLTVAGVLVAGILGAIVQQATVLDAWSPTVVAGVVLQVAAIGCAAGALVAAFAPRWIPGAAPHLAARVVLATPALRLRALADRFAASIEALDGRDARALDAVIDAEIARLVAAEAISASTAAAMREVDAHALVFDAHLTARLALHPDRTVVLRPHVPVAAVAAVLDGGSHGGRLARRIVAAVAGRRSRPRVPWEAGMLVDLVAAARVPILAHDGAVATVVACGRTVLALLAAGACLAALATLAAWREVAPDLARIAEPSASVVLLVAAGALATVVDVVERAQRVRAAPTTWLWALLAGVGVCTAYVVGSATPYSPYLVGLRAPWVVAAAAVAIVAAGALLLRVVERLRGRVHDAVHWRSVAWPLPRARVATLEARRAAAVAAASSAHVEALVVRLRPAIALAVDVHALDASVLASLPTERTRAARR